jgi:hypothetical protein
MPEFPMQRMRIEEDGTEEEYPPRSIPTDHLWSPDRDTGPWPLGTGDKDVYGDQVPPL